MMTAVFHPPGAGATTQDWRFVRVCKAVIQGHSLTRTVFSFYNRECPLSAEAVHLIDGVCLRSPPTPPSRKRWEPQPASA